MFLYNIANIFYSVELHEGGFFPICPISQEETKSKRKNHFLLKMSNTEVRSTPLFYPSQLANTIFQNKKQRETLLTEKKDNFFLSSHNTSALSY